MTTTQSIPLRTLLRAFPGIPIKEAQDLIDRSEVRTYPPGVTLCHEDAYETVFYIIMEGRVKVSKMINASRKEVRHLQSLEVGDFFGEMAILQNAPRAATVSTLEETTVLEIHKEHFTTLLRTSASLSRAMMQEVVRRLRQNDAMAIEDLRLKAGELADAYQQLAEQDYARREFLTTIAHELRTPLTAASGFLHMIENGLVNGYTLDSEMQVAAIQTASRHLQQIVSLVNDIMFVQEMDLILPHFDDVDLTALLRRLADASQKQLMENGINLYLNLPPKLPTISGDMRSLERAFGAVLNNAIKYSYEGGQVQIHAAHKDDKVTVEIRDQGVGISEEYQSRIFERFFHIDQIEGRMFRGVGLGLSIARQVIEQHHGKIRVVSKPQEGTTVIITLNTAQSTASVV